MAERYHALEPEAVRLGARDPRRRDRPRPRALRSPDERRRDRRVLASSGGGSGGWSASATATCPRPGRSSSGATSTGWWPSASRARRRRRTCSRRCRAPRGRPLPLSPTALAGGRGFPATKAGSLATVGLLPPVLRERLRGRVEPHEGASVRALARLQLARRARGDAAQRCGTSGPTYLRWRREAIARGDVAQAARAPTPRRDARSPMARRAAVAPSRRALDSTVEPPTTRPASGSSTPRSTLAAASGIRNLTMDDVADRAGVGRMTVYRRFGDKRAAGGDARRPRGAALPRRARRRRSTRRRRSPIRSRGDSSTSLRLPASTRCSSGCRAPGAGGGLAALTGEGRRVFAMARAFVAERLREAQAAGHDRVRPRPRAPPRSSSASASASC